MLKITVDCQTGKQIVEELTPDEESQRLKEISDNLTQVKAEQDTLTKQQLVRELAELREMKLNRAIFNDQDISEKQKRIDRLSGML